MTDAAQPRTPQPLAPAPPTPPRWAERTVAEDGGLTHELISTHLPHANYWSLRGGRTRPTEVSLAVIDRRTRTGWVRGAPTVQVEGGSYGLPEIRRLSLAIDELLRTLEVRRAGPRAGAG